MDRSTALGDAVLLMRRAQSYVLLSELFNTVDSTLEIPTPIPDHLLEILTAYGSDLGGEIADVFACMSLVMFGSLFLSDRDLSPLLVEDFAGQMRERVDYFRDKRNQMIAHRSRYQAQEISVDRIFMDNKELGRGRVVISSVPSSAFGGNDVQGLMSVIENSLEILNRKWDEAFAEKAAVEFTSAPHGTENIPTAETA